jgi:AbrB family looped-hinge helix DNA binding protein
MSATLTVDKSGRVVLPKAIRDQLQLDPGTELQIKVETADDTITLRPVRPTGHLRKKNGVWVWSSGSGKTLSRQNVIDLIDRVREERMKQILGEDD